MFGFFKRIARSRQHAQRVKANTCPTLSEMPYKQVRDDSTPSWPPVKDKVDFVSIQDMFRTQANLIKDLMDATGLTAIEKEKYFLPVLTNVAKWTHLLPASEYLHHQGLGGLFAHSLQVALYGANKTKLTNFSVAINPKDIELNRKRWVLVGALAGLLHDIGKVITDMEVTSGGKRWQHAESLVDWLLAIDADSYIVSFVPNRARKDHCEMSHAMIKSIIPEATIRFLNQGGFGDYLINQLNQAILHGAEGGMLGKILITCDSLSVREDIENSRQIPARYKSVSHPQADGLLKAMRILINNKEAWKVNCPTGRVFLSREGCFIEWDLGAQEAYAEATQSLGFRNLPQDSDRLASILVDAGVAVADEETVEGESFPLWTVTPIDLNLTTPTGPRKEQRRITAVRIADASIVFDSATPPRRPLVIEGRRVDPEMAAAFEKECGFIPKSRISAQEMQRLGYTEELIAAELNLNRDLTETVDEDGNLAFLRTGPDATMLDAEPIPADMENLQGQDGYESYAPTEELPQSELQESWPQDAEPEIPHAEPEAAAASAASAAPAAAASNLNDLLSNYSPTAVLRQKQEALRKEETKVKPRFEEPSAPVRPQTEDSDTEATDLKALCERESRNRDLEPGENFDEADAGYDSIDDYVEDRVDDDVGSTEASSDFMVDNESKDSSDLLVDGEDKNIASPFPAPEPFKNTCEEEIEFETVERDEKSAPVNPQPLQPYVDPAAEEVSVDPENSVAELPEVEIPELDPRDSRKDFCAASAAPAAVTAATAAPAAKTLSPYSAESRLRKSGKPRGHSLALNTQPPKLRKALETVLKESEKQALVKEEAKALDLPDVKAAGAALKAKMSATGLLAGKAPVSCPCLGKKASSAEADAKAVKQTKAGEPETRPSHQSEVRPRVEAIEYATPAAVSDNGPAPAPWDDVSCEENKDVQTGKAQAKTRKSPASEAPAEKSEPKVGQKKSASAAKSVKPKAAKGKAKTASANAFEQLRELLAQMVEELRRGSGELISETPCPEGELNLPTVSAAALLQRAAAIGFSAGRLEMAIRRFESADGSKLMLNVTTERISLVSKGNPS